MHNFLLSWFHCVGIEDDEVGRESRPQHAAIIDPEGRGRIKCQAPNSLFQRHDAPFSDPIAQKARTVTYQTTKLYVRTPIGKTDHRVWAAQNLRDRVAIAVVLPKPKDRVQLFLHSEIEEGVQRFFTPCAREFLDAFSLQLLVFC